jgi:hypothetical protein
MGPRKMDYEGYRPEAEEEEPTVRVQAAFHLAAE